MEADFATPMVKTLLLASKGEPGQSHSDKPSKTGNIWLNSNTRQYFCQFDHNTLIRLWIAPLVSCKNKQLDIKLVWLNWPLF